MAGEKNPPVLIGSTMRGPFDRSLLVQKTTICSKVVDMLILGSNLIQNNIIDDLELYNVVYVMTQ